MVTTGGERPIEEYADLLAGTGWDYVGTDYSENDFHGRSGSQVHLARKTIQYITTDQMHRPQTYWFRPTRRPRQQTFSAIFRRVLR